MSGLNKLGKLKKTNTNFEQDRELAEKMKKGLKIKLVNGLSSGTVVYSCPISRREYVLDSYMQELVFGFDEFNYLVNNKKNILKGFALIPVGCEVDEYDKTGDELLKDVLRSFGLAKLYDIDDKNEGGDYLYINSIDDIILELKFNDFKEVLEEVPFSLYEKIVMRAIDLVKEEELTEPKKIKYFIDSTGDTDLFSQDTRVSSKVRKI